MAKTTRKPKPKPKFPSRKSQDNTLWAVRNMALNLVREFADNIEQLDVHYRNLKLMLGRVPSSVMETADKLYDQHGVKVDLDVLRKFQDQYLED